MKIFVPVVPAERVLSLTPREVEILYVLAMTGAPFEEIAKIIGMTLNTARTHSANIGIKLNLHGKAALVAWAWRSGWMPNAGLPTDQPIDECNDCGADLWLNQAHLCPVSGTTVELTSTFSFAGS